MKNDYLHDSPKQWIEMCERSFHVQLDHIVEKILGIEGLKIIRLTGPTCSGKTTVANLLIRRLDAFGKRVHLVSIDDFFFDKDLLRERAAKRGEHTVDYESVNTLDLEALGQFVSEFSEKDVCHCPCFDFRLGKRTGYRLMDCRPDDIFIFEGIQVLYPEISSLLEQYHSIGIYIEPNAPIEAGNQCFEPNEIRLLRRIVRDFNFRGTDPERTFDMWRGVRRNEEKNIFPYIGHCAVKIDSTMPYEIGILKPYLETILPLVGAESPHRATAERILNKIEAITPLSDQWIPADSLYKEFV